MGTESRRTDKHIEGNEGYSVPLPCYIALEHRLPTHHVAFVSLQELLVVRAGTFVYESFLSANQVATALEEQTGEIEHITADCNGHFLTPGVLEQKAILY